MTVLARSLALFVLGASLAACGAAPDVSPAAGTPLPASVAAADDGGTSSATGHGQGAGGPASPTPGGDACALPVGPDPADIQAVLVAAVQEEHKAESLYRSVLEDFGSGALPFATIADSETRHVEVLEALLVRRGLPVPASAWSPATFAPFATVLAACAAGVTAEVEDAAFYEPHLTRSDLPQDVRNVFSNLQAASLQNHLPAFEACR